MCSIMQFDATCQSINQALSGHHLCCLCRGVVTLTCCPCPPLPRPAATALIILGSICFIPGFYHVRIAYKTWKKVPGFTLDAIPDI
jgi:hypothetical protein